MLIHTQPHRFTCNYCDRSFILAQYLREHQYVHTKELPYVCGINGCNMRFRQAGKLSMHRKSHPEYSVKKYNYELNKKRRTKIQRSYANEDLQNGLKILNNPINNTDLYHLNSINKHEIIPNDTIRLEPLPIIAMLHNLNDCIINSVPINESQFKLEENHNSKSKIEALNLSIFMKVLEEIINPKEPTNLSYSTLNYQLRKSPSSTLDLFNLAKNYV